MKIAIGTVQFGTSYGVSNQIGRTKNSEIEKIFQYAYDNDINILDTALAYGNSESLIGSFAYNDIPDTYWNIVTKTPSFKSDAIGSKQTNELLESFRISLEKLSRNSVYGLLIHDCNNLFLPGGKGLIDTMGRLKEDGFVEKIGVSLYSGEQIDQLLDNYAVDLVQLPINILDQRLIDSGQLKRLKKYGIEIHARSAFLQGLLLMPINSIPPWFNPIRGALELFNNEAKERGMSTLQLALSFVQSIYEIDTVVVGINTLEQLREIVSAASMRVNTIELSNVSINNSGFLNPSNWKI
jgi:aryl-alcohol dehydrogenase-like predicted oxidoreductase